jgi:hypothetical protein
MNPILIAKISAAVVALLASFWLGTKVNEAKWLKREVEIVNQVQEAKEAYDKKAQAAGQKYEDDKAANLVKQKQLSSEIKNEITKPSYDCPLPADGLRLIKRSASDANTAN